MPANSRRTGPLPRVTAPLRHIDTHRERLAGHIETLSMATGVISGIAAVCAGVMSPTGFNAFCIWLGLSERPLVLELAPVLGLVATISGILSGTAYFYCRWRRRHQVRAAGTEPESA